jgi:hypothetical protein
VFNFPKGSYFYKLTVIFLLVGLLAELWPFKVQAAPFPLAGPIRRDLLALAKEPLSAILESRSPREPASAAKGLEAALPLVVTVKVGGQLIARTWQLERPEPLQQAALILGAQVLTDPKMGRPLTEEELPQAVVSLAVLSDLKEAKDDQEVRQGQATIVLNGFKQSVGLPSDVPIGAKARDLLNLTCQLAGLRPGAWMTSRSTILTAQVSEVFDK